MLASFSDARKAFKANFTALLSAFNYSVPEFALRINQLLMTANQAARFSTTEIDKWKDGKAIPNVYCLYKLAAFFKIKIDDLFDSNFNVAAVTGRQFATQVAAPKAVIAQPIQVSGKTSAKPAPINNINNTPSTTISGDSDMKTNKMIELIKTHTSSETYNKALAYSVLNSDHTQKTIAAKIGISPRTLRDVMYYGATISESAGNKLARVLKVSNVRSLGLKLNKETARYEHV